MINLCNFLIICALLTVPLRSIAENNVDKVILFETENPRNLDIKNIYEEKEIYLEKESVLREKIDESGIYGEYYYTRNDKGRLSLAYHFTHDFENLSKLQAIDFQILTKVRSYKDQWWGVRINRVIGKYSALADELVASSGHSDADSNIERLDAKQSMTSLGLGLGYRFNILQQFFESQRVFEQIMAYGSYIYHLDQATDTKYQGYGLSAEYGIHKRISQSFFTGAKLTYNIASLVRAQKSDENKIDRSLVLRWTSIGFEFGYFY